MLDLLAEILPQHPIVGNQEAALSAWRVSGRAASNRFVYFHQRAVVLDVEKLRHCEVAGWGESLPIGSIHRQELEILGIVAVVDANPETLRARELSALIH